MSDAPSSTPAAILVVEDETLLRESIATRLTERGHRVHGAADAKSARAWLAEHVPDVVVLDVNLPDLGDETLLPEIRAAVPDSPVIVMTAYATVDRAVTAFHDGAWDFLPKPFPLDQLDRQVANALETTRLRRDLQRHRTEATARQLETSLVARSTAMRAVLDLARRAAAHPSATVLLEGESGTGKSVLARAIHDWSPGRDGRCVTVACAAIPEALLESELFGHVRGAFTGATGDRAGMAELADGGTLFLDEIGEMPPGLQAKLLYLLETGRFRPVGSETEREISARIVAATNRDLAAAIQEGAFREDLYFRLKVVPIHIPPLRDRREDIPLLVQHFLELASRELDRSWLEVSAEAMAALQAYRWPGNLRELRNVVERAVVVGTGPALELADLPPELRGDTPGSAALGPGGEFVLPAGGVDLDAVERNLVEQALRRTGGNRTEAGRLLGLNRDGVRYRIRKYGIDIAAIEAAGPDPPPEG